MCVIKSVRESFQEIDKLISKSSSNKKELASVKGVIYEKNLIPVVSHSFTKNLAGLFYGSFKIQFMADRKLISLMQNHVINTKPGAKDFCRKIGVSYPETYLSWTNVSELSEELVSKGVCIKAVDGVGGIDVFGLIKYDSGYRDLFSGVYFENYESLIIFLRSVFKNKKVEVEKLLIGRDDNPAVDIKFFTFYGECPLVLQIDRWGDRGRKNYFFQSNGTKVKPRSDTSMDSSSIAANPLFDVDLLSLAKKVSLSIPAPFCRIDFLLSNDGAVLCEFTFNVGGPGRFEDEWDNILGMEYSLAKTRLYSDFIEGKKFDFFKS